MKMKKLLSALLVSVMAVSALAGCGEKKDDGPVTIKIGTWPSETNPAALEKQNKQKEEFEAANPNITIEPDTYSFGVDTFYIKAAGGQLPNMFIAPFTDAQQIIDAGYAADMTGALERMGYNEAINPDLLDLCERDGKYYGFPYAAYATGLYINKPLFKQAGLVNEDGSIKVPTTWDEVGEFSQIIREKTGKAGLVLPTTGNCGGWRFVNVAWDFGVNFVEQQDDGTWKAVFDTQETYNALQYIKDLRWKYNALVDESVVANGDVAKHFGAYNAAMAIASPPMSSLFTQYGMKTDEVMVAALPAGPEGQYSQMGGSVIMFSADTTEAQMDAIFKWLEFTGVSPNITDERAERIRENYQVSRDKGEIVLYREAFDVWVSDEYVTKSRELRAEYTNVTPEDYEGYFAFDGVTIRPEPEVCCQQLYATLDGCIQEVITNKDADVKALISQAAKDFQQNHLDKM